MQFNREGNDDLEDKKQRSLTHDDRRNGDRFRGLFVDRRVDDLGQQPERNNSRRRSADGDSDTGADAVHRGRPTRSKETVPDADARDADAESDDETVSGRE